MKMTNQQTRLMTGTRRKTVVVNKRNNFKTTIVGHQSAVNSHILLITESAYRAMRKRLGAETRDPFVADVYGVMVVTPAGDYMPWLVATEQE